jgi:2-oxoisovalerate dehydrogenase E2 component (dihydrolipoyl transacylase)
VETAKAVVEVPSPFAGTVVELIGEVGATIEVGEVFVRIDVSGGAVAADAGDDAATGAPMLRRMTSPRRHRPAWTPTASRSRWSATATVRGAVVAVVAVLLRTVRGRMRPRTRRRRRPAAGAGQAAGSQAGQGPGRGPCGDRTRIRRRRDDHPRGRADGRGPHDGGRTGPAPHAGRTPAGHAPQPAAAGEPASATGDRRSSRHWWPHRAVRARSRSRGSAGRRPGEVEKVAGSASGSSPRWSSHAVTSPTRCARGMRT